MECQTEHLIEEDAKLNLSDGLCTCQGAGMTIVPPISIPSTSYYVSYKMKTEVNYINKFKLHMLIFTNIIHANASNMRGILERIYVNC